MSKIIGLNLVNVFAERSASSCGNVDVGFMRAFVRLHTLPAPIEELARKFTLLENNYDAQLKVVFDAIRELMTHPEPKRRPIGFGRENG